MTESWFVRLGIQIAVTRQLMRKKTLYTGKDIGRLAFTRAGSSAWNQDRGDVCYWCTPCIEDTRKKWQCCQQAECTDTQSSKQIGRSDAWETGIGGTLLASFRWDGKSLAGQKLMIDIGSILVERKADMGMFPVHTQIVNKSLIGSLC